MLATLLVVQCVLMSYVSCSNRTDLTVQMPGESGSTHIGELCTGETFRPRCAGGKNDVIVIVSARYGRMSFGRCLVDVPFFANMAGNPLFVGCSQDVKHILDQYCSGLSQCDVRINDQSFEGVQPCFDGLKMHLEVSYSCVKVVAESRHCTVTLTTESQHIVGGSRSRVVPSDAVDCGSEANPWTVNTLAGQRIAVSIIDFDTKRTEQSVTMTTRNVEASGPELASSACHPMYGYMVDRRSRMNVSMCGNRRLHVGRHLADETTIYISLSNELQLVTKSDAKFIIRLDAVGCSDLAPPSESAYLKRVDDSITVGCYMSRQSWQLKCVNGVWTGTVGVCSDHEQLTQDEQFPQLIESAKTTQSYTVLAMVAVAGAGVTLCCLVVCTGIICLRRQQRKSDKKHLAVHTNRPSADTQTWNSKDLQNRNLLVNAAAAAACEEGSSWRQ